MLLEGLISNFNFSKNTCNELIYGSNGEEIEFCDALTLESEPVILIGASLDGETGLLFCSFSSIPQHSSFFFIGTFVQHARGGSRAAVAHYIP